MQVSDGLLGGKSGNERGVLFGKAVDLGNVKGLAVTKHAVDSLQEFAPGGDQDLHLGFAALDQTQVEAGGMWITLAGAVCSSQASILSLGHRHALGGRGHHRGPGLQQGRSP